MYIHIYIYIYIYIYIHSHRQHTMQCKATSNHPSAQHDEASNTTIANHHNSERTSSEERKNNQAVKEPGKHCLSRRSQPQSVFAKRATWRVLAPTTEPVSALARTEEVMKRGQQMGPTIHKAQKGTVITPYQGKTKTSLQRRT